MIGKLTGLLDTVGENWATLDVGGVGYIVFCSGRTLSLLPPLGQMVTLQIETHVREDHIHLYGFNNVTERDWFRMLTTVQGVGAKVALSIMTTLTCKELTDAVFAKDKAIVGQANGIGPKLAQRIVAELHDKIGKLAVDGQISDFALSEESVNSFDREAVSALVNLGFSRMQAIGAVSRASQLLGPDIGLDDLIKFGLKELSQ